MEAGELIGDRCIIQVRDGEVMDQTFSRGDGEKWSGSNDILKGGLLGVF